MGVPSGYTSAQVVQAVPTGINSAFVLINSTAFTTATSVSLPNDTFTATFSNYRIVLVLTALTADADFTMRLRAAASDDTNSNYQTMFMGINAAGSDANQTGSLLTSFLMGESDGPVFSYSLSFDLFNPNIAVETAFSGGITFFNKAATASTSRSGGGRYRATTVFDSLTFISSVASSMTGIITTYGYSES
jgi:hypothetical protein